MSQNTRTMDENVDGTVYTATLNSALESMDSCHSGTVAPTLNLIEGKLWADTNTVPAILKIYTNSTWVIVYDPTTVAITGGTIAGLTALTVAGLITGQTVGGDMLATQAEAEAGLLNDQVMTPLRTAEAIAALAGDPTLATKSQAEAGTENTATMTALRTQQAITENAAYAVGEDLVAGTTTFLKAEQGTSFALSSSTHFIPPLFKMRQGGRITMSVECKENGSGEVVIKFYRVNAVDGTTTIIRSSTKTGTSYSEFSSNFDVEVGDFVYCDIDYSTSSSDGLVKNYRLQHDNSVVALNGMIDKPSTKGFFTG